MITATKQSSSVIKTKEKQYQANGKHKLTGPGPGRPKGTQNRYTKLKNAILGAVDKAAEDYKKGMSCEDYLATICREDPTNFLRIASGLIPKESKVDMTTRSEDSFTKELAEMDDAELKRLARATE